MKFPSAHALNGKKYDAEVILEGYTPDLFYSSFHVFFEIDENAIYNEFFADLEPFRWTKDKDIILRKKLNLKDLFTDIDDSESLGSFFKYIGSSIKPPCEEYL
jgi:hypothetical protein